jgi:histidyl-tRNA synthetase
MNIQTLKGFRDFLPAEARKRQFVISTLKSVFALYGFDPLETPTLEYEEILTGKYGEEGEKLMYRFEDNGGRRVAMRYDQTVPLARVAAQYQGQLPTPFKRYQVQPVWRAENTQRGRYREFLQCDIDTVGTDTQAADAEILAVVAAGLEKLGFTNYRLLINDRRVFGDLPIEAIITIDKLKKIGEDKVKEELNERGIDPSTLDKVKNASMPDSLKTIQQTAIQLGVPEESLVFEPTLARGLDYYTGIIIEVEIDGYTVGSVGGGGRYDNLLGMFAGRQIPAVGFAFGFDRIMDAMNEKNLFPEDIASTKILVTIFSPELVNESVKIATKLRNNNIATELWLDPNAKMDKQLRYADQKQIPYVVILGPNEQKENIMMVKNLKTRDQKKVTIEELIDILQAK